MSIDLKYTISTTHDEYPILIEKLKKSGCHLTITTNSYKNKNVITEVEEIKSIDKKEIKRECIACKKVKNINNFNVARKTERVKGIKKESIGRRIMCKYCQEEFIKQKKMMKQTK